MVIKRTRVGQMVLEMTRVGQNGIEKDKSMTRWIKDEQE